MNKPAYDTKFADFIFMLAQSREQLVVIHHPQVLGDDYDEIVESLNRLSISGKHLAVIPPNERG